MPDSAKFKKIIRDYYRAHGRHDMSWRKTKDPYKIFVSEVMLQQTQVDRVMPKYENFIKKFPTFAALVNAPQTNVLKAWQGLGYNRRALNLKKAAEIVTEKYAGKLPKNVELLDELPGIGHNTAAAICAYAFNMPVVYIETNIRRIYIHFFFPKAKSVHDEKILPLVAETLDTKNPREWYWALMDYGTYLKTQVENPNRKSKHYTKQSKFEGSDRQLRGKILKLLLEKSFTKKELVKKTGEKVERVEKILEQLEEEGFLQIKTNKIILKK